MSKHHNNASGTAFFDFTKRSIHLPGTIFSYVITFPLYLSCSFSERCLFFLAFGFAYTGSRPWHFHFFSQFRSRIARRGLVAFILEHCRRLTATSGRAFLVLLSFLISLFLMSLTVEGYFEFGLRRGWLATLPTSELSLAWADRLIFCISWTNGGNDRKHCTDIGHAVQCFSAFTI